MGKTFLSPLRSAELSTKAQPPETVLTGGTRCSTLNPIRLLTSLSEDGSHHMSYCPLTASGRHPSPHRPMMARPSVGSTVWQQEVQSESRSHHVWATAPSRSGSR